MAGSDGARAECRPGGVSWDPLVRLTHWGIAVAVLWNGLINEEGSWIHVWVGYAALSLLILRLLWGVIGPGPARFAAFPPSPSRALGHVRALARGEHPRYRSHNPLGALMAYALWACLAIVIATGVAMETGPFERLDGHRTQAAAQTLLGDADDDRLEYQAEEDERLEVIEEVHETAANLLLILAALHVAGVVIESRLSGANLVRAMTIGARRDDAG